MKKFILLITTITGLVASGYCQSDTSTAKINNGYTSNQYLAKAKNQKTAAWICVGGGVAFATTGLILASTKVIIDVTHIATLSYATTSNYTSETVLALVGAAGITASIPLFIASAHNGQRAKLMLTLQTTSKGLPAMVSKNVTGLTLSIAL